MLIQIVLFDGFDLLDAIAPYEVFCAAEMYSGGALSVELVSAEGARLVPSGLHGLTIAASGKIDSTQAQIILVPGASGEVNGEGPNFVPAILRRAMETDLTELVKQALGKPNLTVATVCGGSLLLAMGGLLEGRNTVTNHLGMDVLGATGAIPVRARVVDDGNLVTGGGVTSGLDVALYLVERELGPRIALSIEKLFEYERRGTVWQAHGFTSIDAVQEETPPIHSLEDSTRTAAEFGSSSTSLDFEGIWNTTLATPIGKLAIQLNISTKNAHIQGTAKQGDELIDFVNPIITGNRLTWSQRVTKPMRLNLKFDVSISGDTMAGGAKAGVLPTSKLVGERIRLS